MAETMLLGLFHEATPTADTIDDLRRLGVAEDHISVMSGTPYSPEVLGRHPVYERLVPIALTGAAAGLLTALFFTVGTPLLYPLVVGGQPIVPGPPSIVVIFELTMLGTIIATFAGLVATTRFPPVGRQTYDYRITEGHIGVLARLDTALVPQAEELLKARGAHHLQQFEPHVELRRPNLARWGFIVASLFVPLVVMLLAAYAIIAIPLPNQMVDQPSVAYDQGPRLAAPPEAVPVQGPALIADQPATEPISPTADSLQRGGVLYGIDCSLCHGLDGTGHGPLAKYFSPPPADLTGEAVQNLPEAEIFLVITQGRSPMPSLAENLSPVERWDVVNYVRTLKK